MNELLRRLLDTIAPMSASNLVLFLLAVAAGLLLGVILFAPTLEARLARSGRGGANRLTTRMVRQWKLLRQPGRTMREAVVANLFVDSDPSSRVIESGDFFDFMRLAISAACFLGGAVLVVGMNGSIVVMLLPALGWFGPLFIARRHNAARTKAIAKALPRVLPKLETRISAGASLREALAYVARTIDGPLATEFEWAARQLSLAAQTTAPVLYELDERTGLKVFHALARELERGEATSEDARQKAFLGFAERIRTEAEDRRAEQLRRLEGNVTKWTLPFLIIALIVSTMGPLIITFVSR